MQIAIYLLIAFLIAIAAFAAVIWLKIHKLKKTYPEEAQEKNLRARYHQLLDKLNEAVDSGDTELSMLNALQAINYPAETLFVSWVKKHHSAEDGIFILDRRPSHKIASGIRYRSGCNGVQNRITHRRRACPGVDA